MTLATQPPGDHPRPNEPQHRGLWRAGTAMRIQSLKQVFLPADMTDRPDKFLIVKLLYYESS